MLCSTCAMFSKSIFDELYRAPYLRNLSKFRYDMMNDSGSVHGSDQNSRVGSGRVGSGRVDSTRPMMFRKPPAPTRPMSFEDLLTRSAGRAMAREETFGKPPRMRPLQAAAPNLYQGQKTRDLRRRGRHPPGERMPKRKRKRKFYLVLYYPHHHRKKITHLRKDKKKKKEKKVLVLVPVR